MSQIKIGGTPQYLLSVMDVLKTIRRNRVGNIIISNIEALDKDLVIVPIPERLANRLGDCNAGNTADNRPAASPTGISGDLDGESAWYKGSMDDPNTPVDERYEKWEDYKGTGEGSDVHLQFSLDRFGKPSCPGPYGALPDEVLLHEMVHSLRKMQGRCNFVPTEGNLRGYDNEEEFLAIVVTNVYMSANGKTKLRANHDLYRPLADSLGTSAGFLADPGNLKLMNIYKLIWQPTFWYLHLVDGVRFNPFRELTLRFRHMTGNRIA